MLRTILTIVIPLIAPTVAYLVWMHLRAQRREDEEAGRPVSRWQQLPWPWLILSGAGLAVAAILAVGYVDRSADMSGRYVPPRLEDGKVVPGYFEKSP